MLLRNAQPPLETEVLCEEYVLEFHQVALLMFLSQEALKT
jgi:hypothetical protein